MSRFTNFVSRTTCGYFKISSFKVKGESSFEKLKCDMKFDTKSAETWDKKWLVYPLEAYSFAIIFERNSVKTRDPIVTAMCMLLGLKRNYSFTATLHTRVFVPADKLLKQRLGINIDYLTKEEINLMLEPYAYTSSMPIEGTKLDLIEGLNYWLNIPDDTCKTIKELFSNAFDQASMVDDIHDSSDYRRGLPTPHRIFGVSRTIICSISGHFIMLKRLLELNHTKAAEAYIEEFLLHLSGQCQEITIRDTNNCPTVEEYQRLFVRRVLPTMSFVIKIMEVFSDCKIDLTEFSKLLAVHYQYLNDLSNLSNEKCWGAKGFCEDIVEGKYTLPTVHAINTGTPEGNIVAAIMRQKNKDLSMLKYCHSLLVKLGSIDYATEAMMQVEEKLMMEIERLGGNPPLVRYIKGITNLGYDEGFEECYKIESVDNVIN